MALSGFKWREEKFQVAIQDVQEKMDAELEVRQGFLKENDLRRKR